MRPALEPLPQSGLLLGAQPWAIVFHGQAPAQLIARCSPQTMLEVVERCFPQRFGSREWQERLRAMIPAFGLAPSVDASRLAQIREQTQATLKLSSEER